MLEKNRQRLKSILASLTLFAAASFLCVIAGEAFLRIFPGLLRQDLRAILILDSQGGVRHQTPGVISSDEFYSTCRIDEHGFRNESPWPAKTDIVIVGDSFVFGFGVNDDQSWPALLARDFPQQHIMNLGQVGAGVGQYQRIYEQFGVGLRPRLVLVGLLMSNDGWDTMMYDRWSKSGSSDDYMQWRDYGRFKFNPRNPIDGIKGLLKRKSYLFALLLQTREAYLDWSLSEPKMFNCPRGGRLQLFPSRLAAAASSAQPDRQEFRLMLEAIERIQSLADQNGTKVLFVFQPDKEQVYLPLLEPASHVPDPGLALHNEMERRGISDFDLTPMLRQRAQAGECLYFEKDGHPNVHGYAAIAEIVSAYLKQNARRYGLEIPAKFPQTKAHGQSPNGAKTVMGQAIDVEKRDTGI